MLHECKNAFDYVDTSLRSVCLSTTNSTAPCVLPAKQSFNCLLSVLISWFIWTSHLETLQNWCRTKPNYLTVSLLEVLIPPSQTVLKAPNEIGPAFK